MFRLRLLPLALFAFVTACKSASEAVDLAAPRLVPAPTLVEDGQGSYRLTNDSAIVAKGDAAAVGRLLAQALRPPTGLDLPVADEGDIVLDIDASLDLPAEGYQLEVTTEGITVVGRDEAGLFYGTQTLRQLLPRHALSQTEADGVNWRLPVVHIEDGPRFGWRGLMIDVARHFFEKEEIERQIDVMALHKLNRLHLHLTDDQGWRIEITSWPELTEIGGSTEVGAGPGGYYTQDDYAELVDYAAERFVTVVPEVDFPGHANAAMASYGELNEDGVPADLYTGAGVISTPLWLDGPDTPGFVEDVWQEVAALTPGNWLHVGGDEAVDVSTADYDDFVVGLQDTVEGEGKTLVGWDEIGQANLQPTFYCQYWLDEDLARAAVADGALLIASPSDHAYLDMVHDGEAEFGQTWAGAINVERAYDWDPVLIGITEQDVAGVEGAMWTEFIDTPEKLDFMVWPRMAALAEVGWTDSGRDWDDFRDRLAWHGGRLDAMGVGYYASPEVVWDELGE